MFQSRGNVQPYIVFSNIWVDVLWCKILLLQFQQIIFLQREDVDSTKKLLRRCARWYHSGELTPKCLEADPNDAHSRRTCLRVPLECRKHNAVYNILHYLVDDEFLPPNVSYRSNENVSMVLIKSPMISVWYYAFF